MATAVDVLVKIIVAIGGLSGAVAFLTVRAQRRKILSESTRTDAEADSLVADAQSERTNREGRILDMSERMLNSMQERLDEAEAKLDRLTEYVEVLVQALRQAGAAVPPMPRRMSEEAHQGLVGRSADPRTTGKTRNVRNPNT